MYIKSIELINVRSYKSAKINFSKGINILTGCNNTGKSTIIKAVYKLQQRAALSTDDIRKGNSYSRIFIELNNIDEKDTRLFHTAYLKNSTQKIIFSDLISKGISQEAFYFDPDLRHYRKEYDKIEVFNEDGIQIDLKTLPEFPQRENENNFIYPFLAKRKIDYYETTGGIDETFSVRENFRNLAAKIERVSNASYRKNRDFVDLCESILGFRIGVIPGLNNNQINIGIYATDDELVSIHSMGDGVANILGLIVTLLTEDRKLYLIEEIENDIHPDALKKLLNLIIEKSDKNQFIISTHSNIVLKYLGSVKESKIFYIESEFDNKENVNIPTSTISEIENKPSERIQILRKLGYDFYDYEMYHGFLILEESSAEQIIREFLIPNFVPELIFKLRTIAANGVNDILPRFIDFNRLFVFIHTNEIYYKKAWVIADGDEPGKKVIKEIKEKFKTWPEDHFLNFAEENFEFYYPDKFRSKAEEALKLPKQEKRIAKAELLKEVLEWISRDKKTAKEEFSISAKEVIEKLKDIAKQIGG